MKKIGMRDRPAVRCGVCCALLIAVVGAMSGSSLAGDADCGWSERFGIAGLNDPAMALAATAPEFGNEILATGYFGLAGRSTSRGAARWDGSQWRNIQFEAISYPFETARGVQSVVWNGRRVTLGVVQRTDGSTFETGAAEWNGTGWQRLGAPIGRYGVMSFAIHDEGNGEQLFACGDLAYTLGSSDVARWTGSDWVPVGELDSDAGPYSVLGLASLRAGAGVGLYALGSFQVAGEEQPRIMASWDGHAWTLLPAASSHGPVDIAAVQSGPARGVYASGDITLGEERHAIVRFDGTSFTGIPGPNTDFAFLETLTIDGEERLFAFDSFTSIGGVPADRIAWWDGHQWHALSTPRVDRSYDGVSSLAVWPSATGDRIVASGVFGEIGGVRADNIAVFEQGQWSALGDVRQGIAGQVWNGVVARSNGEEKFFASGYFHAAGDVLTDHIAAFDGVEWEPVPRLSDGTRPFRLLVADTGSGPRVHTDGPSPKPPGTHALFQLRADGSGWEQVPAPVDAIAGGLYPATTPDPARFFNLNGIPNETGGYRFTLFEFNHGDWSEIPVLEIQGNFANATAPPEWLGDGPQGGLFISREAYQGQLAEFRLERWSGGVWSRIELPPNWRVWKMTAVRSGLARGLYVWGTPSEVRDYGVLRCDAESLTPLESRNGVRPFALQGGASLDFGDGEMLYAMGYFMTPGRRDEYLYALARWDGDSWRLLLGSVEGWAAGLVQFQGELAVYGTMSGSAENPAGGFNTITCPLRACPLDVDADGTIGFGDLVRILMKWDRLDIGAAEDIDRDGVVTLADIAELIEHWDERCP